jgi:CheY-like chemotaxis protein
MATGPALKCPRCSASIAAAPDEIGFVICPQCGSKLRSRAPMVVKVHSTPPPDVGSGDIDSVLARLDAPVNPSATLPPGTPLKKIPRPGELVASAPAAPGLAAAAQAPSAGPSLQTLLAEMRALRRTQDEILQLLRARPVGPPPVGEPDADPFAALEAEQQAPAPEPAAVRTRRRKTVLLLDDDEAERNAALRALEHADVPVRVAADGNAGVAEIALEKPDVIVMELGLSGSMAGKDVINMIKATMEWVDIPIILYTRVAVASQKEARQVHGADEVVLKEAGPEALVSKVIAVFRRG